MSFKDFLYAWHCNLPQSSAPSSSVSGCALFHELGTCQPQVAERKVIPDQAWCWIASMTFLPNSDLGISDLCSHIVGTSMVIHILQAWSSFLAIASHLNQGTVAWFRSWNLLLDFPVWDLHWGGGALITYTVPIETVQTVANLAHLPFVCLESVILPTHQFVSIPLQCRKQILVFLCSLFFSHWN